VPNRSSNAGHIPSRTCVICRHKKNKSELLRFVVLRNEPVFDLIGKFQARGFYVCDENSCIEKIDKWILKYKRKIGRRKKSSRN
jgi:uncharacterized protein